MTEEQLRELFREMREDSVPPDSLVRVRARLAERMRPRFNRARAAALFAVPVLSLLLTLLFLPPRHRPVELPRFAARVATPPALSFSAPAPVATRHRARSLPRIPPPAGAAEIRIETSDPNVVILLTGE